MTNINSEAKKDFVDRMYEVEKAFQEAKAERGEMVKDLVQEIKARMDETGVEPAEVKRLVKIKLDITATREDHEQTGIDLETIDELYDGETDDDV